jgi:hypothetical protein
LATTRRTYLHPLWLTFVLAGCSSQASPEYVGNALITLHGSVKVEDPPEGGQLKPALAFFNGETGTVHIVNVAVDGEFPSDFTLRVTQPPPDAAFFTGPAGIRSALGYVTAVTADRPDSFRYATQSTSSATCYSTSDDGVAEICETQRWWCSGQGEGQQCYGEEQRCVSTDDDVPDEPCEIVETVGDPALKETWSKFAGLSEDLVLAYLSEPLSGDHDDAVRLGLPGLDAGYTVLEPQPEYDPDSDEGVDCDKQIQRRAFELYAAANDTGLSYDDLLAQGACGGENEEEWIPCDPRTPTIWHQVLDEFEPIAAAEIGCRHLGTWRIVGEEEREHVKIRIGTGVQPSLFSPDRVSQTRAFTGAVEFGTDGPEGLQPFDPCNEPEIEPVAWDGDSPLGETPAALFGAREGGCTSTLVWDHGEAARAITPSTGSTEVDVALRFDHASARYVRFPNAVIPGCRERLEIDGELAVHTADGALDDTSPVTVVADYSSTFVSRPIDEHGGTLSVQHTDSEALSVDYELSGTGDSCAGRVSYSRYEGPGPDGERSIDESFVVGAWSNNGCDVGQQRVSLDDPIDGVGASPVELVQRMFGDVTLTGHWQDDGSEARVQLSATSTTEGGACVNGTYAFLPVAIAYAIDDGVVGERVVDGEVELGWRDPAHPDGYLLLKDAQECTSASASLAYAPADCAEQLGVVVQTQLSYKKDALAVYDDALFVYTFDRDGVLGRVGNVESADHRRILELDQ